MSDDKGKILATHFENMNEVLSKYSKLISTAKHKVNLGAAREGLIVNFLSQTLPENIQYHTGEIFDSFDKRSGQVDVIIHPIGSPKLNLFGSINIFPFETVLAAIEVKSIITTDNKPPHKSKSILSEALKSCEQVKNLTHYSNNAQKEPIPFILFAYRIKSNNNNLIVDKTRQWAKEKAAFEKKPLISIFKELPDMIVVLDKGICLRKIPHWMYADLENDSFYEKCSENVLFEMFSYIIELTEKWSLNPSEHFFPSQHYFKELQNYNSEYF